MPTRIKVVCCTFGERSVYYSFSEMALLIHVWLDRDGVSDGLPLSIDELTTIMIGSCQQRFDV